MPVTQQDIAEELGISRVLVSYALNGNPRVSEETRKRVQETAERLGYRPNRAAQTLVTGRTGQIALCFSVYQPSFNSEISRRFQSPARSASYALLVSSIEALDNAATPLAVDGAICQGLVPAELLAQGFPTVSLEVDLRGVNAGYRGLYDVVQVSLEDAARQATRHLIEEGCKRIAYVSVPGMMGQFEPRYRAYAAVMRDAGLAREDIYVELLDYLNVRDLTCKSLETYFTKHGFPDALFCSNDDIAVGAYRALRRMGRSIPHETAVIGCDDIEEAQDHAPALSSIHWPFDAICQRAWQMLMERIATPSLPPRLEQIKTQFVPRASSQRRLSHAATPTIQQGENHDSH